MKIIPISDEDYKKYLIHYLQKNPQLTVKEAFEISPRAKRLISKYILKYIETIKIENILPFIS